MFQIDPLSFIPDTLKTAIRDAAVDFVSDQAKKLLGEEISSKIKKLRSDAGFNQKFEKGLQKALKRFTDEYVIEDEDLVAAIVSDPNLFKNEQVQRALLEMVKNPGKYMETEHEKVAECFESVLPGRRNRERVDKAIIFLLRCLAEELWSLPELQPIYSLQFQKVNTEAMKQLVVLQKAQLQALTNLNEGVRQALLQLTDAVAEKKLLPGKVETSLPVFQVQHNLPIADYGEFVGREAEMAQIHRILRRYPHSQHSLVTIDGIGGIGKSTLALEAAHYYLRNASQLPPEERFEAIIWTSAKLTILTTDGIKIRYQSSRTLKDIYTAIAITLQREDITRATANEQAEVVRNALTKQRTLIIVDNLETIDDDSILSFLRELPAPTKAIVTTRHRLDVAYPIRLTGMSWEDGQHLIQQECEAKNVVLQGNEAHQLFDRTGGVPLAIVWSIAQIGVGRNVKLVLERLGSPTNDIANFCFDESIKTIRGTTAFQVLLAISLFAKDAERRAIAEVTRLPDLDLDEGLTKLEVLSLVNKLKFDKLGAQLRFSLLPLTKSYVTHQFQSYPGLYQEYWVNLAKYYALWSEEKDNLVAGKSVESYADWRYERENFLTVIDQAYNQKEYRLFLDLILTASYFQFTIGYWRERQDYAVMGVDVAQNIGDMNSYARLKHDLAYMANYEDEMEDAYRLCQEAQNVFRTLDDDWHLASSLRLSGTIAHKLGNLEKAKQDLNEGAEIMLRIQNQRGYAIIVGVLANVAITENDFEKARELLNVVLKIATEEDHFDSLSHCWAYFGKLAHAEGKLDEAEKAYRTSLGYEERMERSPYQAQRMFSLATVLREKGQAAEAKLLAEKALDIAKKVGMKKVTHEAELILKQLA